MKYLVSFTFNDERDFGYDEYGIQPLTDRHAAIYVVADEEQAALKWATEVASRFMRHLTDPHRPSWQEAGHTCTIETDIRSTDWVGAESFLQTVRVNQEPDYDRMSPESYMDWLEEYGQFDT